MPPQTFTVPAVAAGAPGTHRSGLEPLSRIMRGCTRVCDQPCPPLATPRGGRGEKLRPCPGADDPAAEQASRAQGIMMSELRVMPTQGAATERKAPVVEACQASVRGTLLRPGEAGYVDARTIHQMSTTSTWMIAPRER
jgi:hypothetical protein